MISVTTIDGEIVKEHPSVGTEYRSVSTLSAVAMLTLLGGTVAAATETSAPSGSCALLTQSQVSTALGVDVEPGKRPVESDASLCAWREQGKPEGPARNVMVTVIDERRFDQGKTQVARVPPPMPSLGIGDDAYFLKLGRFPVALYLKKGTQFVRIMARTQATPANGAETATDQDEAVEKKLAQQILGNL